GVEGPKIVERVWGEGGASTGRPLPPPHRPPPRRVGQVRWAGGNEGLLQVGEQLADTTRLDRFNFQPGQPHLQPVGQFAELLAFGKSKVQSPKSKVGRTGLWTLDFGLWTFFVINPNLRAGAEEQGVIEPL